MMHAERLSQQGNWVDAGKAYRFALAEFPNDEAAIVGFGKSLFHQGQAEQAWRAFQQVLKVNPNNLEAMITVGDIQAQMKQPSAAAQTYLRAGNLLAGQKKLEDALELWHKATELVPDYPEAHRNLAHGLAQLGEPRLAARQFLTLAAIYQRHNDMAQAGQQIEAIRRFLPDDPGVPLAMQALRQRQPLHADMISEEEPQPEIEVEEFMPAFLEPEEEEEESDFPMLLVPDEDEVEEEVVEAEVEDELGGFFEDEEEAETVAEETEDDPFGLFSEADSFRNESNLPMSGGLLDATRQKALSELANVIFEDDAAGPERSVLPDGREVSRMEINMFIIQAIDLQTREEYDEAIERYRLVTQANAGRPALHYNLGLLHQEMGDSTDAIKMLRLSAQDPNFRAGSLFALGQTYYDADQPEMALRQFADFLKAIDVKTVDEARQEELEIYYDNLADEFLASDNPTKVDTFIKAVTNFFAHPDWETRIYEARKRMDSISEEGIMSLAEFLESPETEVVVTALATTNDYLKLNLPKSASEECLRAIQKAPSYLPLHTRLADILLKQDLTDAAIKKYLTVATVYEVRHQVEQSIAIFKKILKIAPLDVTVRNKLIDVYMSRNKVEPALENYLVLADAYYQLAQIDKALQKYDEAMRLTDNTTDPGSWKVKIFSQKGDIYSQRFEWDKATTLFEQAYRLNPRDERASRQLVDLYYKQNKTSQAIKVLDGLLGVYYREKPGKAVSFLKELVAINPDDMFLRQRLAISYMQDGRKNEAIAEYDILGEMQLNQGQRNQAIQTIQAILKMKPDNPEGYRQLLAQIQKGAI